MEDQQIAADLNNFLHTFDRKLGEYVEQLRAIKVTGDEKALQSLLHKLKSSARTFGSYTLASLAENFEQSLIEQQQVDLLMASHQIEQEIKLVLNAINQLLNEH